VLDFSFKIKTTTFYFTSEVELVRQFFTCAWVMTIESSTHARAGLTTANRRRSMSIPESRRGEQAANGAHEETGVMIIYEDDRKLR
jgi:hypothetical protein